MTVYEGLVDWLREMYPDLDEGEIRDRAEMICQAWADGVIDGERLQQELL